MSISNQVRFEFTRLRREGRLVERPWDLLLRVVADFAVSVDDQRILAEQEFCVIEFAKQALDWRRLGSTGPFRYTSIEALDQPGLVHWLPEDGGYRIGSSSHPATSEPVPASSIMAAIDSFLVELALGVNRLMGEDIWGILLDGDADKGTARRGGR